MKNNKLWEMIFSEEMSYIRPAKTDWKGFIAGAWIMGLLVIAIYLSI